MRIIFITRESRESPGARVRCYNLANGLKKLGLDTAVLSFADDLGAPEGKEEHKMGIKRKLFFNLRVFFLLLKEKKDTIFFIQRSNYHSLAPFLVHLIRGNRLILDIDDWELREDLRYYSRFFSNSRAELLLRLLAGHCEFILTATFYLRGFMMRYNKKVYVLRNAVDVSKFSPMGNNSDKRYVLFSWVGTMHRTDDIANINFIIECFSELKMTCPDIHLDIVGDGRYFELVRSLNQNGMSPFISIKSWIRNDLMSEYLDAIDVGLCPLIQNTRFNLSKSPVKLLEYMAMGKSVVASRIGEAAELISDGENGFLARDKEEFINKMRILTKDKHLRERMGLNALKTIRQNFTTSQQADSLYYLIRKNCMN